MKLHATAQLMEKLAQDRMFDSYAVLVGYQGKEVCLTSPNVDEETYFDVASMGKMMVTTPLVLQAVGKGRLTLEDTLDMFFPNVPEEKKKITIHQLLTHTSGILRHDFSREVAAHNNDYIASVILSHPLGFAPGSDYAYSCCGMVLLGFILEKIHRKTLDEIFYLDIKAPLGMVRARFNIALDEENAAQCRRWKDNSLLAMDDEIISVMRNGVAGNGGEFMALESICKFVHAVMMKDTRLYSKELFALAEQDYTPQFAEGRGLGYLVVDDRYPQTGKLFPKGSFGHCGHTGQSVYMHRDSGLYVILLTNATRFSMLRNHFAGYDYGEVMALRERIHNQIYGDLFGGE